MATLNSSNIVNGNIVETTDILQLYDALTAGGGTTGAYNISISGSITGSATTATTAATASSATNLVVANTSSGVYYPIVVDGTGTKPPKTISTFELSGSVLNNITASHAITASYALNAATPSNTVTVSAGSGETNPLGDFNMKAFAGITDLFLTGTPNSQSVSMSQAFPNLTPSTAIGTDLWVNATPLGADVNISTGPIFVSFNDVTKVLTFETLDSTFNGAVVYTGYAK
jgi:hypothetical protein